ncbi:MAG: RHS repeat-associated core domain-containing protein, partial [Planctomycetes bacterium]|nr:RHS repeat-associated core domain-containing protein [Planctomycetota bacterium]
DIDHKTSGGTRFAGFAYAWDQNDNPLMEQRSHQSGKGDVYSYDKVNRLTKVLRDVNDPVAELATPNSETYVNKLEYNMDDVFNLTSYVVTPYGGSASTTSYTTDAMNQYTAIGSQSPTYTDAGSLKDDGTLLYKYDAHQHLIEVRLKSSNALVAEYAYDALGLGRRITKVVGSATTRYVHAGPQAIEEWDGTGSGASLRRLFVFGERIDQIVAMEAPDQADVDSDSNTTEVLRFSFHTQLIGSVTQVSGPAGSVVESYEYDPYGKPTLKDQGGSTITASAIGNSYLFTARQLDEETGLYYYRARHYSADLRRFIQRDPLEYVDGPNAVGYVSSRPTRFRDPHGKQTETRERIDATEDGGWYEVIENVSISATTIKWDEVMYEWQWYQVVIETWSDEYEVDGWARDVDLDHFDALENWAASRVDAANDLKDHLIHKQTAEMDKSREVQQKIAAQKLIGVIGRLGGVSSVVTSAWDALREYESLTQGGNLKDATIALGKSMIEMLQALEIAKQVRLGAQAKRAAAAQHGMRKVGEVAGKRFLDEWEVNRTHHTMDLHFIPLCRWRRDRWSF